MRYAEARTQIKTGDLLAWSAPGDLESRHGVETHLTRIATESQWTHVGLAWAEHGRVWVMELTTKGCAPRLLSALLPFYWAPAPKPMSEEALQHAFSRFGVMEYSRWEAFLGWLKRLVIGSNLIGECAEYCLEVWNVDQMSPTVVATPYACVDGAQEVWGVPLYKITE